MADDLSAREQEIDDILATHCANCGIDGERPQFCTDGNCGCCVECRCWPECVLVTYPVTTTEQRTIQRLRGVLHFYAAAAHYTVAGVVHDPQLDGLWPDRGEVARVALGIEAGDWWTSVYAPPDGAR